MHKTKKFPDGFLWGSATSSHQVEGGNHNDWSEWEKKNAVRLARESSKHFSQFPSWEFIQKEAEDPKNYLSGNACDHYHHYEEDFDIAASLGHNAHRFSIEWSRIEPEEGVFDEQEIEHYRNVLLALRKRNIEPFVTLWHWTIPVWLAQKGGWENKHSVEHFLRYAEKIVTEYRDLVRFWMPLNEPGTFVGMSYIQGAFPPQKRLALFAANRVFKNLMRTYRKTYSLIKKYDPDSIVGMSHYAVYMFPSTSSLANKLLVKILDYIRNWRFLDSINQTNDFIGIQYYHTDCIAFAPLGNGTWGFINKKEINPWGKNRTDMGWDIYPEGMYHLLRRAAKYKKPIYITENGLADMRDALREDFIKENLLQVHRAITEGVDIRGYFYWSLLDNFEWNKGYWPRFGLISFNKNTLKRTIRPSAYSYKKICDTNTLEI